MIAEAVEIELERFGFDQIPRRQIVDHQMRKIWLTGDRAEGRELRGREPCNIVRAHMRVRHAVEDGPVRGTRDRGWAAQLQLFLRHWSVAVFETPWMPVSRRA